MPFVKQEMNPLETETWLFESTCSDATTVPGDPNLLYSRYKFLGQKYFQYALLEALVDKAKETTSDVTLRTDLDHATDIFPYRHCIKMLDVLCRIDTIADDGNSIYDQQNAAWTKMGAIIAKGDQNLKRQLRSMIQSRGRDMNVAEEIDRESVPEARFPNGSASSDDEAMISMSTIQLYELRAKRGKMFAFSDAVQLCMNPSRWQIELTIDGESFSGMASSIKNARHDATRKAMEHFRKCQTPGLD